MKKALVKIGLLMVLFIFTAYPGNTDQKIEVMRKTYTITHKEDHTTYTVVLVWDYVPLAIVFPELVGDSRVDQNKRYRENFRIQLFDVNNNLQQSFSLDCEGVAGMEFRDVNTDGYTDMVINTGGTMNETHDMYIWDISSKNFIKVVYDGFEMLSFYEVYDGYMENFLRGPTPEESELLYLIWHENVLTVVEESDITPTNIEEFSITDDIIDTNIQPDPVSIESLPTEPSLIDSLPVEIEQNNGESFFLPLWAWVIIIGGGVIAVGGVVLFMIKRTR
jgi:hypothetical protein